MPGRAAKPVAPLVLVVGDNDLAVSRRAREIFEQWCAELGGMDHEIIDGAAANSADSLKALARLREALQTLPFFGEGKAVWLRDCAFLGDSRAAAAGEVTATLGEMAQEFKAFPWGKVRLLVSAGEVDRRKSFYKIIEKIGAVECFAALSVNDRDWPAQAEQIVLRECRSRRKTIADEALAELVDRIGPNESLLVNEVEKVCLYAGDQTGVGLAEVQAVCSRNKNARAFALGDALGDRDLGRLLRCLDEELWEMKFDRDKSEIGLLYGVISKVRAMLFLKEMLAAGWLKPTSSYEHFKGQLKGVTPAQLPADRRFNPLALNPYVLFKALPQAGRYSQAELVQAMDTLLQCNRKLVTSGLDETLILQQALVKIVSRPAEKQPVGRGS